MALVFFGVCIVFACVSACYSSNNLHCTCSFTSSVVLHVHCADLACAVIITAARLLGQEESLRNTSGEFVWEKQGLEINDVEGVTRVETCIS